MSLIGDYQCGITSHKQDVTPAEKVIQIRSLISLSDCQRNLCVSGAGPARPRVWGLPAETPSASLRSPARSGFRCL